jgi:molybdenum cofactor synthesis domain-containing protein
MPPQQEEYAVMSQTVTAAILVIGNEILSGRTQDANIAFIARRLSELGIRLREARVVPDIEEEIISALDALRARYDHVFTTGGIGPTHDDITSACVAKAFGVALERNAEAVRRLEAHYADPSLLNAARLRMANIPAGATLIDNPVSAAPGFRIGNVHVLPGVPSIMQAMFDGLASSLAGGPPIHARTVNCTLPEGTLAEGLGALQERWPQIEIGSYPWFRNRQFGVSLVLRGTDGDAVGTAASELCDLVRSLGGDPILVQGAV